MKAMMGDTERDTLIRCVFPGQDARDLPFVATRLVLILNETKATYAFVGRLALSQYCRAQWTDVIDVRVQEMVGGRSLQGRLCDEVAETRGPSSTVQLKLGFARSKTEHNLMKLASSHNWFGANINMATAEHLLWLALSSSALQATVDAACLIQSGHINWHKIRSLDLKRRPEMCRRLAAAQNEAAQTASRDYASSVERRLANLKGEGEEMISARRLTDCSCVFIALQAFNLRDARADANCQPFVQFMETVDPAHPPLSATIPGTAASIGKLSPYAYAGLRTYLYGCLPFGPADKIRNLGRKIDQLKDQASVIEATRMRDEAASRRAQLEKIAREQEERAKIARDIEHERRAALEAQRREEAARAEERRANAERAQIQAEEAKPKPEIDQAPHDRGQARLGTGDARPQEDQSASTAKKVGPMPPETPLSIYRMRCTSSGNSEGEAPAWKSYEVAFDTGTKQFTMDDATGKHTVLPAAMIASGTPEDPSYFMVLTQSQINTAEGVAIVNLQALFPTKPKVAETPLSFQISVPHGQVLRADHCTSMK